MLYGFTCPCVYFSIFFYHYTFSFSSAGFREEHSLCKKIFNDPKSFSGPERSVLNMEKPKRKLVIHAVFKCLPKIVVSWKPLWIGHRKLPTWFQHQTNGVLVLCECKVAWMMLEMLEANAASERDSSLRVLKEVVPCIVKPKHKDNTAFRYSIIILVFVCEKRPVVAFTVTSLALIICF